MVLPFILDIREEFGDFVNGKISLKNTSCRTPNPCVLCIRILSGDFIKRAMHWARFIPQVIPKTASMIMSFRCRKAGRRYKRSELCAMVLQQDLFKQTLFAALDLPENEIGKWLSIRLPNWQRKVRAMKFVSCRIMTIVVF